jgi:hypothetical protein
MNFMAEKIGACKKTLLRVVKPNFKVNFVRIYLGFLWKGNFRY